LANNPGDASGSNHHSGAASSASHPVRNLDASALDGTVILTDARQEGIPRIAYFRQDEITYAPINGYVQADARCHEGRLEIDG